MRFSSGLVLFAISSAIASPVALENGDILERAVIPAPVLAATISQVVAALSAAAIDIQAEINSLANIVSADVPELDVVLTGILTANGLLTKAEGLLKGVGAKA